MSPRTIGASGLGRLWSSIGSRRSRVGALYRYSIREGSQECAGAMQTARLTSDRWVPFRQGKRNRTRGAKAQSANKNEWPFKSTANQLCRTRSVRGNWEVSPKSDEADCRQEPSYLRSRGCLRAEFASHASEQGVAPPLIPHLFRRDTFRLSSIVRAVMQLSQMLAF